MKRPVPSCAWLACRAFGLAFFVVSAAAAAFAEDGIRCRNYRDGDEIRFPSPLLQGEIIDATVTRIDATVESLHGESAVVESRPFTGLASGGRFKVLVELRPGVNRIRLRGGVSTTEWKLVYRPATNSHYVRVIWMTDRAGDARYASPQQDDPQDIDGRLDTAMKLLQTAMAERLFDLGFDRRTFRLEYDERGRVKVHRWKRDVLAADDYELFVEPWHQAVDEALDKELVDAKAKHVVIAAYTRFDPKLRRVLGHASLGKGRLALFGSGSLFAWPSRVDEVQSAFLNGRAIDPEQWFSDSADRHTWWSAASTSLGTMLHEIGHLFDLPHSRQPSDFMTRGGDHMNRVFVYADGPTAAFPRPRPFLERDIPAFQPISAASLVLNRWLSPDEPPQVEDPQFAVEVDAENKTLRVSGRRAPRYVGFLVRGDVVHHVLPKASTEPAEALPIAEAVQERLLIPLSDLKGKVDSKTLVVRVQDEAGNLKDIPVSLRP
ncbi:MAG: hypothetical protein RIS70_2203 [Planctomycetota bacterium]